MNYATDEILNSWQNMENRGLNKHVSIDFIRIEELALQNYNRQFPVPNWKIQNIYPENDLVFASYQLAVNCFNFAFNDFENPDGKYSVANPADKDNPFTGAFGLDRKFYEAFGEKIIEAQDLAPHFQSLQTAEEFFKGINQIPCCQLRLACGQDYIRGLEKYFQGNPLNLLDETTFSVKGKGKRLVAFNSGKGLVDLLIRLFPVAYGQDVQFLRIGNLHLRFPFHKRAQLVAVMLHGRSFFSSHSPCLGDIEQIGPLADYQVPKVLRADGVLQYSGDLAGLVDSWKEIPKDSQMEIEIRASTVAACCCIQDAINGFRKTNNLAPINIAQLDYWLWAERRSLVKKSRPHLARTSSY